MEIQNITERAAFVYSKLATVIKDAKSELCFESAFTLLIATILSAQATDKSVNLATPALFKAAPNPSAMILLGEEGVYNYIKHIGLAKSKARHIIGTCKALIEHFGGEVPNTREDLMTLPGVGEKTSAVVLNVWFKAPTIPVDTHVFRVSRRLHLSDGSTPSAVEKDLLALTPALYAKTAHHLLLLHGRRVCKAKKPLCKECVLREVCDFCKEKKDF